MKKNSIYLRKLANTSLVFAVLVLSMAGCATKQTSTASDNLQQQKAERMFNSHDRSVNRERASER